MQLGRRRRGRGAARSGRRSRRHRRPEQLGELSRQPVAVEAARAPSAAAGGGERARRAPGRRAGAAARRPARTASSGGTSSAVDAVRDRARGCRTPASSRPATPAASRLDEHVRDAVAVAGSSTRQGRRERGTRGGARPARAAWSHRARRARRDPPSPCRRRPARRSAGAGLVVRADDAAARRRGRARRSSGARVDQHVEALLRRPAGRPPTIAERPARVRAGGAGAPSSSVQSAFRPW